MSTQRSKRHHYVPECYLRAWADTRGHVLMRRRGSQKAVVAGVKNVAVESDLYTFEGDEGPSDEIEQALAQLEGPLTTALEAIAAGSIPSLGSEDRYYLSLFMAVQHVRSPESLARAMFPTIAAEATGESPISPAAMGAFLRDTHLGFDPAEPEVSAACDYANYALSKGMPSREEILRMKFQIAGSEIAPVIAGLRWSVERCNKPRFITTDRPVAVWRTPKEANRLDGLGIANAEEVRFPLSPRDLLVLRHAGPEQRTTVLPARGSQVSEHLARQCHRLLVAQTDRAHYVKALPLGDRRPAMRFNRGPLIRTGPDGHEVEQGEVIHTWVPDSE